MATHARIERTADAPKKPTALAGTAQDALEKKLKQIAARKAKPLPKQKQKAAAKKKQAGKHKHPSAKFQKNRTIPYDHMYS